MFIQHARTHARTHAHTHTHVHTGGDQALSAQGLRLDEREARREEGGDLPHLDDTLVLLHRQPIRLAPSAAAPGAAGGRAGPGKAQGECWRGINTAVCVSYVHVCVLYVHTCTVRGVARGECWRGVYDREAERPGGLSACMCVYATCIDAHACRMHMQVFTTARPRRRKGSRSFRTCCAAGSAQPWQTTAVRAARPVRGAMMSHQGLTWGRGRRRGLRERRRCRCRSAPELWCRMGMVREQRHRCQPCLRGALLAASDLG